MPGPWEKYRPQAGQAAPQPRVGQVFSLPPDPQQTFENNRVTRNDAVNQQNDAARIAIARAAQQRADQAAKAAQAAQALAQQQVQQQNRARRAPLDALNNQLRTTWDLYAKGPGATKGISGLMDFVPGGVNSAFDAAAASLAEIGQNAFRTPGIGSQSDKELAAFVAANRPSSSDWDAAAVQKLKNLENRLANQYKAYGIPYRPYRPKGYENIDAGGTQNRTIDFNDLP